MAILNSSLLINNKPRFYKTTPVLNMGGGMNTSNIHTVGGGIYKNVVTQRVEDGKPRTISWTETMNPNTKKDLELWWNNNNAIRLTIVFDGKTFKNCVLESYPDDSAITKDVTITFIIEDMASF